MTVEDVRRPFRSFSHPRFTVLQVLEREGDATLVVADIRQLLNTFNAAVQLPSDVLVMIPSFFPLNEDLFAASKVCLRWRTILVSSPLLWRRMDCQDLEQTIISLERRRSVPLWLDLDSDFSPEALEMVLDHGHKVASVSGHLSPDQLRSLDPRLVTSTVEELVLFAHEDKASGIVWGITADIRGKFMSMRKLSISGFFVPIDKITAPNLIHLSLEDTNFNFSETTVQSVLKMLRGCLQLETVLINILSESQNLRSCRPVALPKLRSIELGFNEVCAGLVLPLHLPPGVAVGFRGIVTTGGTWAYEPIKHVLATIHIKSVTLAHIGHTKDIGHDTFLIRFEGPTGSLEIIVLEEGHLDPFGPDGLLLSHSPRLENVKTLRIMDCRISDNTLMTIASAMPNLVSISFLGRNAYLRSLTPTGGSPALFPHLEHIAGLPLGKNLMKMVATRKNCGSPLKILDTYEPRRNRADLADLRKLVEDVRVWRCADLPERWTINALLDAWEAAGYRGPVSDECYHRNES